MKCFCGASNEYKREFWEHAPQELWNRLRELQSQEERDLHIPFVWDVRRPLVLIVEPDTSICRMAKKIIENLGYGTIVGEDGKEGLSLAKQYKPDFVLTAALMPKLDGREMARLIKENRETAHIKIAIMTSLYTQQKYHSEAFKRFHVDEYLNKPLDVKTLQNLLHKYLDVAKPLQS
jgi:CheY-like chemotaxis protein